MDRQREKDKEKETDRATGGERDEGGERLMLGPWDSLAQSAGHASERMC